MGKVDATDGASRTTWQVWPFTLLDTVGEKTFTDDAIAAGTATVAYTIQAKRGKQVSPVSEALSLRFGHGGGGAFSIASGEGPAKLAA